MKNKIPMISSYLLGTIFLVFGIAGLFNLIPPPPDMPAKLMAFMGGLVESRYMIPFIKLTEAVCGLLLLLRIAPALALIILAPITINIFLIHLFLTPGLENLILPVVILVLQAIAAKQYWGIYKILFYRLPNIPKL